MQKAQILFLILSAFIALSLASFPTQTGGCNKPPKPQPLPKELPQIIQDAINEAISGIELTRESQNTAALSVGIVYDQDLIYYKGFGLKNISDPTSVPDADTKFRIGSISKIFAMLGMMIARDEGYVHLDSEVTDFIPEFGIRQLNSTRTGKRGITLRQLANHLSGLPREAPCHNGDGISCANISDAEIYDRIKKMTQILPTDTLPQYSNLGYSVLGNVLARVYNVSYEDFIQMKFVEPMGLKNTGVNISKANFTNFATPYLQSNGQNVNCPELYCHDDYGWNNPCGSLYSTVNDLSKIVSLALSQDKLAEPGTRQILDGASIRETFALQFLSGFGQNGFVQTWEYYQVGNYYLRTKSGSVDGFSGMIALVPELKFGFVVQANSASGADAPAYVLGTALIPAFEAYFRANQLPEAQPPLNLSAYVGTYVGTKNSIKTPGKIPQNLNFTQQNSENITIQVTFEESMNHLFLPFMSARLQYVAEASTDEEHVFRAMPPSGTMWDCMLGQFEENYQLCYFKIQNGQIVSVRADISYGIEFFKVQPAQQQSKFLQMTVGLE